MFRKAAIYIILAYIFISVGNAELLAQFGKNKVQYSVFKWMYLETEHFDIYYDEGSKSIGEFAAVSAEKALLSIQNTLNHQFSMRIALIVYDSHNDFQQTNVTGSYMPEGVGGFTELFKNRVVVPFQGSFSQLRHVIHHELVHAVLNDMFYGGTIQSVVMSSNAFMIPLWLNEGLAEYESLGGMNTETDMFMRDLTISEKLPPLTELGGYLAYRGGQTFYWYIADKYGKAKVTEFINKLYIYKNLEQTFLATFNMKLVDFSEMWARDIKKVYWPDLTIFDDPKDFAQKITDRRDLGNYYNTSPAISPNGEQMAFISDRDDGIFAVYIQDLDGKKSPRKLISSLRKQDFEDLNLLTPGISWDPKGEQLAISAKSGGQDAVFIVNAKSGDYERLPFGIKSITSVTWSKNGKQIAFIGSIKNQSDIYVYDIETKKLENITDDVFSIEHIAWSPDSKDIYFVSDRDNILNYGIKPSDIKMWKHNFEASDIYKINIASKKIERITNEPDFAKTSIAVSSDGNNLIYVSDKSGIGNVYIKNLKSGSERAISNSLAGISQISLTPDDDKMLFVAQVQGGYDIFMIRRPLERISDKEPTLTAFRKNLNDRAKIVAEAKDGSKETAPSTTEQETFEGYGDFEIDFSSQVLVEANPDVLKSRNDGLNMAIKGKEIEDATFVERKYSISFSPDIVLVNPGYSTYYGFQGLTQMLFSDVLGDHQIFLGANLFTDLRNSQFYISYSYLPELIDYQIAGYHYPAYFYKNDGLYRFRNYGLNISASLPFDLFTRLEWGADFIGAEMENLDISLVPKVSRFMFVPQGRFVFDNTLGGWYAPERGMRAFVEFMGSPKFNRNSVGFMSVRTDVRQYFKFTNFITMALRGSVGGSFGPNPQRYFLGGTENWINYSYNNNEYPFENPEDFVFMNNFIMPIRGWDIAQVRGDKFFVSNAELRFPLFMALVAGPVPVLLQGVMGSIFFDVGGAWYDDFKISKVNNLGKREPVNMIYSSGIGVRSYVFGLPIKMDIAWANHYSGWSKPKYMFSLGYDF